MSTTTERDLGKAIGRNGLRRLLHAPESSVFVALVVLAVVMGIAKPQSFLSAQNLFNILKGMSSIGVMAIGMTLVIITAGIDLSIGSLLAVSAIVTARLLSVGVHPVPAIAAGLGTGTGLGLVNGLVITRLKVNPFITTLGMLSVARGLSYFFAMGIKGAVASNIPVSNRFILFIGGAYLGPIPVSATIMLVLVVVSAFLLKNSVLGRQIYAVGSNEEAARLSGVNVGRVKMMVYGIMGTLCALAGFMEAGLLSTAATSAGKGAELDVIAAVVIGGASLMGGRGSIYGAILGAAIMAVLRNAFVLLQLPACLRADDHHRRRDRACGCRGPAQSGKQQVTEERRSHVEERDRPGGVCGVRSGAGLVCRQAG